MAALVGGFAGAVVTGWLSVWLEHRRQRLALRAAARLVAGELRVLEARLLATAASGVWRGLRARPLAHGEWDQYRGAFAAQLPRTRWFALQEAYRLVGAIGAAADVHLESDRLSQVERQELATAAHASGAAAAALETDLAADDDRPRHWLAGAERILLRHP